MFLIPPGSPPGPLAASFHLVSSSSDGILHAPNCSLVSVTGCDTSSEVDFLSLSEGTTCPCVLGLLTSEQRRHLNVVVTVSLHQERLETVDISAPSVWPELARLHADLADLTKGIAPGSASVDASVHVVVDELRTRFLGLVAEVLAARPLVDRVADLLRPEVALGRTSTYQVQQQAIVQAVKLLSGPLSGAYREMQHWATPDSTYPEIEAEAFESFQNACRRSGVPVPRPFEYQTSARLMSKLVQASALQSAQSELCSGTEYVAVVYDWQADVRADTPFSSLLAEVLYRSKRHELSDGCLALRIPPVLGRVLLEAQTKHAREFYPSHGSVVFFRTGRMQPGLDNWKEIIELAAVLRSDAGQTNPANRRNWGHSTGNNLTYAEKFWAQASAVLA